MREHSTADRWQAQLGLGALLFVLPFIAYLPAIQAGYIWDDDSYVTQNPTLLNADGLKRIWLDRNASPQYYPLVFTSFWIEHKLWGFEPLGYHLVNVLLHAISALLLWLLLKKLKLPGTWYIAAIFVLHPVMVESVAWIAERKNVLSAAFYLGAMLMLFWGDRTRMRWGFCFGLFTAAMLSKTTAATFPAAVMVTLWWKQGNIARRDMIALLPFFALSILLGLNTAYLERNHVGAIGPEYDLSVIERILIAGRALWFYLSSLLLPHRLAFMYERWSINAQDWSQYLHVAGFGVLLGILFAFRKDISRGPLAAMLLFAGTLAPALGFFNVFPMRYTFVADHYQYLASIPIIALLVGVMYRLNIKLLAPLLLVALGILTYHQSRQYDNLEALWTRTIEVSPRAWLPRTNLAEIRIVQGRTRDAEMLLRDALHVHPHPEAFANLSAILHARGDFERSVLLASEGLKLNPNHADCLSNLGTALAGLKQMPEAVDAYRKSIKSDPTSINARVNFAGLLSATGKDEEAIDQLTTVLNFAPRDRGARLDLARVLAKRSRWNDAAGHYQTLSRIYPADIALRDQHAAAVLLGGDAKEALRISGITISPGTAAGLMSRELGWLLARAGHKEKAIEYLQPLATQAPADTSLRLQLAQLLADLERRDEAIEQLATLVREDPKLVGAYNQLANVLTAAGRDAEAINACARSLELDANQPEVLNTLGGIHGRNRRYDEAITNFIRAIRLAPKRPDFRLNYAIALHAVGKSDDARSELDEAAKLAREQNNPRLSAEIDRQIGLITSR